MFLGTRGAGFIVLAVIACLLVDYPLGWWVHPCNSVCLVFKGKTSVAKELYLALLDSVERGWCCCSDITLKDQGVLDKLPFKEPLHQKCYRDCNDDDCCKGGCSD